VSAPGLQAPQPWRDFMVAEAQKLRIALAALRKIRRVGYVPGNRSEESEIALKALRRIERGYK
jgi:hypothetical protein